MICNALTVTGEPPPVVDKYYDCINGICVESAGGAYKNDPTCAGACKPKEDNIMGYAVLGIGLLGLAYILGRK